MQPSATPRFMRRKTTVFFFLAGLLAASWSSRIPDVQQKLGLNDAAWGTVLFALPAGLVTGLLLSSWIVTRFGLHRVVLTSMMLSCLLLACLGWAGSRWQLSAALFFTGASRTLLNMSINTHAVLVQKRYERPIISSFHGVWSVACLCAAGLGTLMIINGILPRWHFTLVGGLCLLAAVLNHLRGGYEGQEAPARRPFLVKPDRFLWLLGFIAFCVMIGENTVLDWSINYYRQVIGAGKDSVTLGYTCFIITMSAGRLSGDHLIRRFGHLRMLFINGGLMATGFAIVAAFPQAIPTAAGFLLVGWGDSILVPTVYALAGRTQKMPPTYALAAVTLIGYGGFLTAPLAMGFISEKAGMQWGFAAVGLLALGIPLLTLQVRKMERREKETNQIGNIF